MTGLFGRWVSSGIGQGMGLNRMWGDARNEDLGYLDHIEGVRESTRRVSI